MPCTNPAFSNRNCTVVATAEKPSHARQYPTASQAVDTAGLLSVCCAPVDLSEQEDHWRGARQHHGNHHHPPHGEHGDPIAGVPRADHLRSVHRRRELPGGHGADAHAGARAGNDECPGKQRDKHQPGDDDHPLPACDRLDHPCRGHSSIAPRRLFITIPKCAPSRLLVSAPSGKTIVSVPPASRTMRRGRSGRFAARSRHPS